MALAAAGALVLSACTSGGDDPATDPTGGDDPVATDEPDDPDATDGPDEDAFTGKPDLGDITTQQDTIAYSIGGDIWQGYNNSTPETGSVYNSVINDRLSTGFWYWGTDGTIYPIEEFGSYQVTSEDPLTVEYIISDQAVWEDGTPITYDDYLLSWASSNPDAIFGEAYADEETSGPFNNRSTAFAEYVPDGPVGEVGGREFTLNYPDPYPDWEYMVNSAFPAHVVAREAGMELEELSQAILDGDAEALEAAAEVWNTAWVFDDQQLPDASLVPSSGPYSLDGATWNGPEFLQLVPNESFFGPPPATANLTFRFTAPENMVQALNNLDLHVIEPQATVDTVQQIEGLGDGFTLVTGDEFTYEHLDFNFSEGDDEGTPPSPFADTEGGLAAREAFAHCVPRQQIIDNLIAPVNPDAEVMNVREVYPFQPMYQELVDASYDGRYDEVDLDLARQKFEESGLEEGTVIRIGYGAPNQRRTDEVGLIKGQCDQIGFVIEDASADSLGAVLTSGDWEIALFGWAGSGSISGGSFWYETDGQGNYGGYSNPDMDEAWRIIQTTIDPDVHLEQLKIVERLAWEDLHSIPVFAFPGVVAHEASVENVFHTATQAQTAWNAEQWRRTQ